MKSKASKHIAVLVGDLHIPSHVKRYKSLRRMIGNHFISHYVFLPQILLNRDISMFDSPSIAGLDSDFLSYDDFISLQASGKGNRARTGLKVHNGAKYIQRSVYSEIVDLLYSSPMLDLASFVYEGVEIGAIARKDLSLMLQSNVTPERLKGDAKTLFRCACVLSCLSIHCLQSFISQALCRELPHGLIVADRYSPYLSACAWAEANQMLSCVISADHVFEDHLHFLDLGSYGEHKLAQYNLQQVCGEYALPCEMYDFAKAYIVKKMLARQSTQSFSPHNGIQSHSTCFDQINQFIASSRSVICYFTSSPDEQLALHPDYSGPLDSNYFVSKGVDLYSSESDFLSELISYCVAQGYGLIIRVHPRMTTRGGTRLPSGLAELQRVIPDSANVLVVGPDEQVSSYWLASRACQNVFFWSNIGIELMMLGFSAVSPNAKNTHTYLGYPFMHYNHPITRDAFFLMLSALVCAPVNREALVYHAIRGFYIECMANQFVVYPNFISAFLPFRFQFWFKGGFIPWCRVVPNPLFSRRIAIYPRHPLAAQFVQSLRSIRFPSRIGYWPMDKLSKPTQLYLSWLQEECFPRLGI